MKTMIEIAREFGMTPAARGRMTLPEDKEAEDEMERLLRGG
jgi:phage terminase small subunit